MALPAATETQALAVLTRPSQRQERYSSMVVLMSVQVPEVDEDDLASLARDLKAPASFGIVRPFDGQALLQTLLPLTIATIPIVTTWLKSRVERAKVYKIVVGGVEISGYSAHEAEAILTQLQAELEGQQLPSSDGD